MTWVEFFDTHFVGSCVTLVATVFFVALALRKP